MNKPVTLLKPKKKNKTAIVKINKNNIEQKNKNIAVNPENLLSLAISKSLPLETIEKLLKMREDLKKEWAREQYYKALSRFQSICTPIKKTKTIYNKDNTPRYRYAPLEDIVEQIKPFLEQCGLSYDLDSFQDDKSYTSICNIHHIDGFSKEFKLKVDIEDSQYMNSIQKIGSTRTYSNRYNFCNALGIMTGDEDDDGNSINNEENKNKLIVNDNIPVCPECKKNHKVIKSKFPGKQWYCLECKVSFNEKIKDVSPKEKIKKENDVDYVEYYDEENRLKGFATPKIKDEKIDKERELANKVLDKVKTPVIKDWFNAKEKKQELLDKAGPYKDKLTKEQINFFNKLKKKNVYTETEYLEDSVFVDELIKNLKKEKEAQVINKDDKEFPEFNDKDMEKEIDAKFHKEVNKITKSLQEDIDRK